jgi:hydrogenase maturation protein HypF
MIERRINSPLTSSLGRLFDAVSALLGIAMRNSYEAEAAMLLENAADAEARGEYPFVIDGGEIDARETIRAIARDLKKATAVPVISMKFHRTVASFSLEACRKARGVTGLNRVVLGGGCFQNRLLLGLVLELLEKDGFEAFYPERVPPNDGGLSLGQAASAAYVLRAPIALLKTKCKTLRLPRPDGASGLAMTAKEHVLSLRGAKPCSRRKTYYRAKRRSNPIFSTEQESA